LPCLLVPVQVAAIGSGTGGGGESCPPLANKVGQTVQNPPPTFGTLCETLCYVWLGCFSAWAKQPKQTK